MAYHVFLSFRGEDTRNTFTAHLYTALTGAGFRTFLDDDGIDRGTDVKLALNKAINEARSSIVVLSKDYASSGWCLDELMMILKRKRTSSGAGHFVLPIFYLVDPSQVRKQTGEFGEVLREHEERLINAEANESKKEGLREKLQGWRRALTEVASLAGEPHQADGNEQKFIQKIVGIIAKWVKRPNLRVARYPVGLESRAVNINSWLQDESINVGIAVIYGMGGIGKTTIAKFAYNLNAERFDASSFLADIRENSKGRANIVRFQKQLLSDILRRDEEIRNVDEGSSKIEDLISCKRVLVVLDDVDDREHFDALVMRDWFHPGSKIILTTRNSHLLKAYEVDAKFEVNKLECDESLELFSWHAFRESHPVESYTELSKKVVQYCGGLPLALEVLGSLLSDDRSPNFWEDTLGKLAAIPDDKILEKLQVSYDRLDYHCKELFLHIACFFIGKGKDFIIRILVDLHPTVGIETLIDKCLLTINGDNKLMMHQLLQQMGIDIVRRESPEEPGERSRLCHHKDSFEVLSEKTGTKRIKGLFLDMDNMLEEDHVELTTDAFTRMRNLKLLLLNNVEIKGRYTDFPRGLTYLSWHGFPLTSIPTEFSLKSLLGLDLRYSKLEQVWKGEMLMASLKILNLSHSHGLKNTPEFTGLAKLEKLVLKDCRSLVEVDESIEKLESLVCLNLKGCKNLEKLPRGIGNLRSLEKLNLSGCSKLDQVLAQLEWAKSLTELHANEISQETSLVRSLASGPGKSPRTLHLLPGSLVKLYLSNCSLSSVADCFGTLSSLKELDLGENPISSLPESIKGLAKLEKLRLSECRGLKSLPELPMMLRSLDLSNCRSLENMVNLPNWMGGLWMDIVGSNLVEVQGMFKLATIGNADAEIINELGLSSELETIGNFEVRFYNAYYDSADIRKSTIQVLYECGIRSIYLPGNKVPTSWCSSNKRMGPSITFHVPSPLNLQIQALKIYVVFESSPIFLMGTFVYITLNNVTKGMKWAYNPWFMSTPPDDSTMDMVWLSYWTNQFILEAGDEVMVSAGYIRTLNDRSKERVKEIGVDVVYGEPEEKGSQEHKAYPDHQNVSSAGDLSAYQLRPGYYNLCNYDNLPSNYPRGKVKIEKMIFGELDSEDSDSDCEY